MSVIKEDLLQLANQLVVATTETHWRTAVSRAYYAAYHGCVEWHASMPTPGSSGSNPTGVHQQLLNKLKNGAPEWIPEHKLLGRVLSAQLGALKAKRTVADYDLCVIVDQAQAASDCAMAETCLAKLQ